MLSKVVFAAVLFVAVSSQNIHYPAGIDPFLCPNYPHCDDPAIAAKSIAASYGFPSTRLQYSAPAPEQYAAPVQYAATPAAATHPAGVDPRICPNYPLCDNELLARFL